MQHPSRSLLPLLLALAPPAAAGELSFFVGTPGGVGDVRVFDEDSSAEIAPAELQGIRLLPIDFAGRTRLTELLPDQPRLRTDLVGASRIVLPNDGGALYRYRRDEAGGVAAFGYLWVDPGGRAHGMGEITSPTSIDPWVCNVAITPAGDAFLAATTPAAGGDLYELELATGQAVDRTPHLGPLAFRDGGFRLLASWGIAVAQSGVLRFDRGSPAARASRVRFGPPTIWFQGDVVVSADGLHAATTAGRDPLNAHVYCFQPSGRPVRVTEAPARPSGGGFLPASASGPLLALSADGSVCMWRTEGPSRETFLRPVPPATARTAVQLTANARFVDTLDTSGDFGFFGLGRAIMLVGEGGTAGVIENADVYQVDFDPQTGGTTITNLTLTSGVAQPPFERGTLSDDRAYLVDGYPGMLLHTSRSGGTGAIVGATLGVPGLALLQDGVKSLDLVERTGDRIALGVRLDQTNETRTLLGLDTSVPSPAVPLLSIPQGQRFAQLTGRADGWVGWRITLGAGDLLGRTHVASVASELLPSFPLPMGPTLAFTPGGSLGFTAGVPGISVGAAWTESGTFAIFPLGARPATYLPAR